MRFIYVILLGLVIFQGMLVITGPFFPSIATSGTDPIDVEDLETEVESGHNVDSAKYSDVGNIGTVILGSFANPVTIAIIGVFVALSGGIGLFLGGAKNIPIAVGIGVIIGLIASLWNSTIGIINPLIASSVYAQGLFTLITVCIGIICVILVGEWLMGQPTGV